jgi:hypothetical protein
MTELSLQLYTLYRVYLDEAHITPMLVDATWVVSAAAALVM